MIPEPALVDHTAHARGGLHTTSSGPRPALASWGFSVSISNLPMATTESGNVTIRRSNTGPVRDPTEAAGRNASLPGVVLREFRAVAPPPACRIVRTRDGATNLPPPGPPGVRT